MNYILGSAVNIRSEIPADKVASTTVKLKSLKDPDGVEILSEQNMSFDSAETNVAIYTFQSLSGTHATGKYVYVCETTNGTKKNLAKSHFFLESQ